MQYPEQSTVFIALSRPAMLLGVSVEYVFITISITLAVIILTDSLAYAVVGLVIYLIGRVVFYWDHHLLAIVFSRRSLSGKYLSQLLGQAYYEVG